MKNCCLTLTTYNTHVVNLTGIPGLVDIEKKLEQRGQMELKDTTGKGAPAFAKRRREWTRSQPKRGEGGWSAAREPDAAQTGGPGEP